MVSEAIAEVARERASFARDLQYIVESTRDTPIREAMLVYDAVGATDAYIESDIIPKDEEEEIKEAIEKIPDDDSDKNAEIDRIVSSSKPLLSLDEVMGITDGSEDDFDMDGVEEMLDSDEDDL